MGENSLQSWRRWVWNLSRGLPFKLGGGIFIHNGGQEQLLQRFPSLDSVRSYRKKKKKKAMLKLHEDQLNQGLLWTQVPLSFKVFGNSSVCRWHCCFRPEDQVQLSLSSMNNSDLSAKSQEMDLSSSGYQSLIWGVREQEECLYIGYVKHRDNGECWFIQIKSQSWSWWDGPMVKWCFLLSLTTWVWSLRSTW